MVDKERFLSVDNRLVVLQDFYCVGSDPQPFLKPASETQFSNVRKRTEFRHTESVALSR